MITVVFFRPGCFYPIDLMEPSDCGRTVEQQVLDNVELNPGTIRVEDLDGNVLWRPQ